ncbi:MAG TPA: MlaD family protein [Hyphomicrobiaceae bacterium]|nr:MlaD family protein [Hyphomicrobiaceae bacterium]
MENKARYAAIGLFTLAVMLAGFLFVYWLQNVGGLGQRAIYQVRFQSPVSGLLKGGAVLFNGIRVGEVTEVGLSAENPKQVMATVAIDPATPVRADTHVDVEFQGLTGATAIALRGGSATAPALAAGAGTPPLLVADDAATQSLTSAAREALRRLDMILVENAEPLKSTLQNLNTFSGALARNSDKLDGIVAGLERFTGGGVKGPVTTYDLTAPRTFPPVDKVAPVQIAVPDPGAPISLDNQKVLPPFEGAEGFGNAQWADSIPKLVQAKVIQAMENAHYVSAVSRPLDALNADYQLLIDIRTFRMPAKPGGPAEVELSGKVLGTGGRILASKVFAGKAARDGTDAAAIIGALDTAFGQAVTELVPWVAGVVRNAPPPAPPAAVHQQ